MGAWNLPCHYAEDPKVRGGTFTAYGVQSIELTEQVRRDKTRRTMRQPRNKCGMAGLVLGA